MGLELEMFFVQNKVMLEAVLKDFPFKKNEVSKILSKNINEPFS